MLQKQTKQRSHSLQQPDAVHKRSGAVTSPCRAVLAQWGFAQRMAAELGGAYGSGSMAHSVGDLEACFQRPASHLHSSMEHSIALLFPNSSDSEGLWDSMPSGKQCSAYSSGMMSQSTDFSSCTVVDPRHIDVHRALASESVRFMGQYPEDMVRAERLLRGLRFIMDVARDFQVDMLNAEMPGVLLGLDKTQRLWADHFMSQMMPPDFLELCQIAAMQQNRHSLFEGPFQ